MSIDEKEIYENCDLLEIILKNGVKSHVFFGFFWDSENIIAIDRYTLVTTICKIEDIEAITLIEKAQDFFESNKQISVAELFKRLMDVKNHILELGDTKLKPCSLCSEEAKMNQIEK